MTRVSVGSAQDATANSPAVSVEQGEQSAAKRPPPKLGRLPFGVLPQFRRDPLQLYTSAMQQTRDLVVMRFGPRDSYTVFHPDYVRHILVDNNRNYRRNKLSNDLLLEVTGLNLLTSDGGFWLRQRRLIQPAFHRRRILGFGRLITACAAAMLDQWHEIPAGQTVDMAAEMMKVTFQVVGRSLFSIDLLNEDPEFARWAAIGSAYFTYRVGRLFAPPLWIPTPLNRAYKQMRNTIGPHTLAMIAQRRRKIEAEGSADESGRQYDMLDLLLDARYTEARDGSDAGAAVAMSDEQIATEIRLFIAAGHETTANTLTWTLALLAQHPTVQARLQAEVDRVLGGRLPTVQDLPQLVYTKMVIEEAMRLYPAAWIIARQTINDDQLGDYYIPANHGVALPIFAIHRHPDFWSNPDCFDPERFHPEQQAARHKFAYLPFGGGPRLCIGYSFALTEAQLILAMIVQRYQPRLLAGAIPEPQPLVTLRVKGGLPMQLASRES